MIVGKTSAANFGRPLVELPVAGFQVDVRFVIDTGSNCLVVPRIVASVAGKPLTGAFLAKLPNNQLSPFQACLIRFDWLDDTYEAAALVNDSGNGLLGVDLLHDSKCRLEVDFSSRKVQITRAQPLAAQPPTAESTG
ncbi:MAG: hypothetical protein EPO10_03045 [Reyranella sp.]|nr:MAG: hypothetical protein EPO10_03045 [Reyranella sp.]